MSVPEEYVTELDRFPPALKILVEAELANGNEITELASCFPAPPAGANVKLARPVTTRRRISDDTLVFRERNTSLCSGEFSDGKGFYFVLEPPLPPPREPDMDAIRAGGRAEHSEVAAKSPSPTNGEHRTVYERFKESMVMNYERWHDGIGYNLDLLKSATSGELAAIESLLISRPVEDWRDVEALAALGTPRAHAHLRRALAKGSAEITTAMVIYAPALVSDAEQTTALVKTLGSAKSFDGLAQTLDLVEAFHPPEVVDALWRGLLVCDGQTAVHFAAMLLFIYGKTEVAFDWEQRPFFLTFNTEDSSERQRQFKELCRRVGLDADSLLKRINRASP